MINNFEEYLTLESIFLISNWGIIPFWLLLLFSPNSVFTRFLVHSIIIPLLLGVAYLFIAYQIYLNDNFTEGETEFPKHNFKAKPKIGKAVLFFNLNNDNTDRRDNSLHGGLPPIVGEKWMCNKWIRMNPHT